jgi:hypothetical protein
MGRTGDKLRIGRLGVTASIALITWLFIDLERAHAQTVQVQRRLPAFQDPARGDPETQMMNRFALTGQYEPGDLQQLARLTVWRTSATLVNVRADLFNTIVGSSLEAEIVTLWNAAQNLEDIASAGPLDMTTLGAAQEAFDDMAAAEASVGSTLGALPGLSSRAADHAEALGRLITVIGGILESTEANLLDVAGSPPPPGPSREELGAQAQLVANDLTTLIATATKSAPPGANPETAAIAELNKLLDLVRQFARSLAVQEPLDATADKFRAARRQMWNAEARVIPLAWSATLEQSWRRARLRMNEISDFFELPRVINTKARPSPGPVTLRPDVGRRPQQRTDARLTDDDQIPGPRTIVVPRK